MDRIDHRPIVSGAVAGLWRPSCRREKGAIMKISVEKNVVELVPENDRETAELAQLWNTIVDCVKFNKKLVPIGEFVPQKSNRASFAIEDK